MPPVAQSSSPHPHRLVNILVTLLLVLPLSACNQPDSYPKSITLAATSSSPVSEVTFTAPSTPAASPGVSPTPLNTPTLQPTKAPHASLIPTFTLIPTATYTPRGTLPGYNAPVFALEGLNTTGDGIISLENLKGRPAVLVFFTTWCPECRTLTPVIVETAPKFSNLVQVIGIIGGESRSAAEAYIRENGITYPVALDYDGDVGRGFNIIAIPTLVFIDSQSRIVNHYIGYLDREQLQKRIQRIIDH